MRVRICWELPETVWQKLYDASSDAPPFQSPGWYAAWHADTGQEVAAVGFKFSDGARAVLPIALERAYRGTMHRARSGVGGGYGGLFGPRSLSERHVALAYRALARRFPDLSVQTFPHQGWPGAPRGPHATTTRTLRIDLAPRETMRKRYFKNRRRDSRFALEYGVDFGPLEGERLEAFLELYHEAAGQWAFDRHRRGDAWWRTLAERLPELALNLAWQQGQVAAARVFAWRAGIAYDLAQLVSPRFRNGEAATAVTDGTLVYAHSLGLRQFDMMPSGGLEGVYRFKESFGAGPVEVLEYRHQNFLARSLEILRGGLPRRRGA